MPRPPLNVAAGVAGSKTARLAHLLMLLAVWACSVVAQSYTWRTVEVGGGGFVTGTVFHPTEPGLVYARTDVGGAYRLDSTTGRWIALNDSIGGLNNEFQHLGILTIGLDPSDANRLYVATGQYGGTESWKLPSRIYRSSDRGATWEGYVVPGFKMAGNGEGRGTGERMAVSPENGSILLLGTSDSGIWRSLNRGVSWARLAGFPQDIVHLNFVLYAPANASGPGPARRVYAAGRTLTRASLWHSDDNGDTWTETPGQPGRVAGQEMFALMGSFDAAGTFFVTWGDQTGPGSYQTNYVVSKVAAGSSTWTSITPPTGQGGFAGISADPRLAGHVVVTTIHRWWPGDEVYRSTNGGTSWSAVLRSSGTTRSPGNSPWAASAAPHWMTDIDIDPFNSDRVMFNTGFGLFQTLNLSASNSARVWTFFNDGLEELVPLGLLSPTAGPPLISVTGDYTGFRHDNLNRSPQRGAHAPMTGSNAHVNGAALAPLRMLRQHSSDTLVSSDAGASWSRFPSTPASAINGHNRTVLSADGTRLLWAPSLSGAYLSTDNGATWNASSSGALLINSDRRQAVSTLAGTLGTSGSAAGSGTSASFNAPQAVALSPTGVRYVADTGNHTIRTISSGGSVTTLAGTAGAVGWTDATGSTARFSSPAGIVFAAGALFVADTGNHTIRRVSTAGAVTTFAGAAGISGSADGSGSTARFNSPRGLASDAAGNLYVADTGNHTIRRITPAGVVTTVAGSAGTSGSADGSSTAARFNAPRGVAVDSSGIVYVADTANHTIRRITPEGAVSTIAGSAGNSDHANHTGGAARFNAPSSVVVDVSGQLHVADTGNHVIRRLSTSWVVTTVAGTAGSTGTTNAEGSAARFNAPAGLAAQPDGFVFYTSETGNHGIRTLAPYRTLNPLADRADAARLYLWSAAARTLLASVDSGATFTTVNTALPSGVAGLRTVPGKPGHLWLRAGSNGLYQSTNGGSTFTKLSSVAEVYQVDLGKEAPGATYPALFIWGKVGTTVGFFRSDNTGLTWTRINTDSQQYGAINDIAADTRTHGRVYLATSGRGVVVGEFAPTSPLPSQPSLLIYGDALTNAWNNASSAGVSLSSSTRTRRGTASVLVPANTTTTSNSAAFSTQARSVVGFGALSFWIHGSDASTVPPIRVGASRGGIQLEAYPVTVPAGSGWRRVLVPLAELGLDGIEDLTGLRIEGRTVGTTLPGAFWIDDIALIGNTDLNTQTQIQFNGLTATFDGTPKAVTVTTTPAGRETIVTYNGSTTPPSAIGSYSVSASLLDPFSEGNALATFTIRDANATIQLSALTAIADGTPKAPTVTTNPPGLAHVLTYDGSTTPPVLAGRYTVVATLTDPLHVGTTTATFTLRNGNRAPTPVTNWRSNIEGKVSDAATSSPLLNPNDTTDAFSTNTLHASFSPIRLFSIGDKLTLSGTFQLQASVTGNTTNWFRFGVLDHRGQAPEVFTGWLGAVSIGSALYERTSSAGLYSTGSGATARTPDAVPTPISLNSPAGNPEIAFLIEAELAATGVKLRHQLRRVTNGAVLLDYTNTDATPNNNGTLGSAAGTPVGYLPIYNTVGLALGRSYVGSSPPLVRFNNVSVALAAGDPLLEQTIVFPKPDDRPLDAPPFALVASSTSGLPVSFEVISGPATVTNGILTLTGAGVVTLRATQEGNSTYESAPPAFQSFESRKLLASVVLSNLAQPYTGSSRVPTVATVPQNLPVQFTFNESQTAPVEVGAYNVRATINDPTYSGETTATFTIERGPQQITFPTPANQPIGTSFTPSATATSGLQVSFIVMEGPASSDGRSVTITDLGRVTLRAVQEGDARWLPAPPVDQAFDAIPGTAVVSLSGLSAMYDGQPKAATVTTLPEGLEVAVTYNGSTTPPTLRGNYTVQATVVDTRYTGSSSGTLIISPRIAEQALTGWATSHATAVVGSSETASPLLNANGVPGGASGSTLHAFFESITLQDPGDRLTVTGTFQLSADGTSGQTQWFRFGLFDTHSQPASTLSGWLGYVGMGNGLFERVSAATGALPTSSSDAAQRGPDSSPTPISSLSPAGAPQIRFEVSATRVVSGVNGPSTGIVVTHSLTRTDTGALLMRYSYTDTSPNNNGSVSGSNTVPTPSYLPRYNAVALSASPVYITGTSTTAVQFSDIRLSFEAGVDTAPQSIDFEPLPDRTYSVDPIALVATSSSGLPVTFDLISGPASLTGSQLTLTGIGEVVLRAVQPGNLTVPPAAAVEQRFQVTKATAVILLDDLIFDYDGTAKPATPTILPAGLHYYIFYNEQPNPPAAPGTYVVRVEVQDALYEAEAIRSLQIIDRLQTAPSTEIELTPGGVVVRFPSALGYTYQLQRRADLLSGDWINLGSAVAGTGAKMDLFDPEVPLASNRFYRIVLQRTIP